VRSGLRVRVVVLLLVSAVAACLGRVRIAAVPPAFPALSEWKATLPDVIAGGLATDGTRVFVATRDGAVRAMDAETGATVWGGGGRAGVLSATETIVLVRGDTGTVWALESATGRALWTADTGVAGTLPVVAREGVGYVAGQGLAAINLRKGKVQWQVPDARVTAIGAAAPTCLLTGEADGALRCRAFDTGTPRWSFATARALLAPPVVRGDRALLGTTDGWFVSVSLADGKSGWRWRLGADLQFAPTLFADDGVLFGTHEAVLYRLNAGGGNLAWRTPLPSRPLSPPVLFRDTAIVAVYENDLLAFDAREGKRVGSAKTPAQIQTPPLVLGDRLFVGLKNRTVLSLKLALVPPPPSPSPAGSPEPDASPGESPSPPAPEPNVATPMPLPSPEPP
jgi:outer membrane protein assembly factor BamB